MSCKKKASRKTAAASSPSTLKEQRAQALETAAAYLAAAQDLSLIHISEPTRPY